MRLSPVNRLERAAAPFKSLPGLSEIRKQHCWLARRVDQLDNQI
jgi:hypothetical protein